jgi:uncharacterized protein (TIGR02270 family)
LVSAIEADIFEQHAREASFLWILRDSAVTDPLYDLADLCELDERIEAHIDGLRLAGDAGWEACKNSLAEAEEGGEVFAAALIAIERWDLRGIAHILNVGGGLPDLSRAIVSAMGWASFDRVRGLWPGLLAGRCPPELHYLGIAGCAVHRQDPGAALGYAALSKDRRLKARALRAAGELGRADLLPLLEDEMRSDDEGCRFWAAWSAALLGAPEASRVLWAIAAKGGAHAARACAMVMRRMDPGVAYTWLYSLAGSTADMRVAVEGAAALGDATVVGWLIEWMKAPEVARVAAGAIETITGVKLSEEGLEGKAPEGFQRGPTDDPEDEDVEMDPDESLPWPDVGAIQSWWSRRADRCRRGTRYLLGKPMGPEWLEQVLRTGNQPARASAAVELCLRQRRWPLFEVRAPGSRQRRALGASSAQAIRSA